MSAITASRALRNERNVDAGLVARVMASARKLGYVGPQGYRPAEAASHVMVLVPSIVNAGYSELVEALQIAVCACGYHTLAGATFYNPDKEEQLLRSLLTHRPAGLVVTGFDRTEGSRHLIERSGVPCVHVMDVCNVPGVYSVGFSQTEAGAIVTDYLLSTGRRSIALVAAPLDARTLKRAEGYRCALSKRGLYDPSLELFRSERSSMALGGALLEDLLRLRPHVDAALFSSDELAQGAILAAQRHGIAVPHRIAIVGFDDLPGSAEMHVPLTTLRTPRVAVGKTAGDMLCRLMQGMPVENTSVRLDCEIVVRQSA